ncbi:MAG: hypothetical protein FWD61_12100 [Phycisphaerales bacterium]|nr:hypothetical protein [Phycisphaerales bacterium]
MRRFLYYIPGVPGVNPAMLADRGLLDRFTRRPGVPDASDGLIEYGVTPLDAPPPGAAAAGPHAGVIVAAGNWQPDLATTTEWGDGGGGKFWLAIEGGGGRGPKPEDMERELGISGSVITLADGKQWRVPRIRTWDREKMAYLPNLPQALSPVGGERYEPKVVPAFAAIDALADRIFKAFAAAETVSVEQLFADAVSFLSLNYRIGVEEAAMLGMMDETDAVRVLMTAIDMEGLTVHAQEMSVCGLVNGTPRIEQEEL